MLSTPYILKEKSNGSEVFIQTSKGRKNIGHIKNNTYYKIVQGSRHLFRVLGAWGIDSGFFNSYLLPNNSKIVICDKEDGTIYEIDSISFNENAVYYHFRNEKEDFKTQLFLPRKFWSKSTLKEYQSRC